MNRNLIRPFARLKLLTFAALVVFGSCHMPGIKGNGKVTTETRAIGDFSAVEAGGIFNIEWVPGAPSLSVTTDSNLLPRVRTDVSGKTLRIDWSEQLRPTDGIKVRISSSSLTGAQLNGAVRFSATHLAGAPFFLEGNGATRTTLTGTASGLTASLNGASRLDAGELQTATCEMAISGAGRAEVNATESLRVSISGAGKVIYGGNPKTVQKNISGAGSIKRRE